MFDFAWSEIALIGVVALVAIGPKDMPVAIRAVATMVKKARRLAAELHTHVDDMIREADLQDVRDQFNSIRRLDLRDEVERRIDPDGAVRRTLRDEPFKDIETRPLHEIPPPPPPDHAPDPAP
jgi:sec-independent protein translocase protein TatB